HAAQRDVLAVDHHAAVRVELETADAKAGLVAVHDAAVAPQRGDGDVAMRLLVRWRAPQPWLLDARPRADAGAAARDHVDADRRNTRDGFTDRGALVVQRMEHGVDLGADRRVGGVVDLHAQVHGRRLRGYFGRGDGRAPLRNVHGVGGGQPYVAVQAAARVPARGLGRVVEADRELVAAAESHVEG